MFAGKKSISFLRSNTRSIVKLWFLLWGCTGVLWVNNISKGVTSREQTTYLSESQFFGWFHVSYLHNDILWVRSGRPQWHDTHLSLRSKCVKPISRQCNKAGEYSGIGLPIWWTHPPTTYSTQSTPDSAVSLSRGSTYRLGTKQF